MTAPSRIYEIARAISRFRTPGDPLRERLCRETPHMAAATMATGLDRSLHGWDEAGLTALWSEEQARLQDATRPSLVAVVLGGVLPPSHIQAITYPLLLGAEVIVKTPSRDPLFPALFEEALGSPALTLVGSLGLGGLIRRADAVIVVGDDDSVRALQANVHVGTPFLGFGHRSSCLVVNGGPVARSGPIAGAIAQDLATFDQLGCLSPREILVVGGLEDARHLAGNLAQELVCCPRRVSLGTRLESALRTFRAAREIAGVEVLGPDDLQWGVVVEDGGRWSGTPGGRHVVVRAIPSQQALPDVLGPLRGHLSAVGLAGAPLNPVVARALIRLGASRICPVGQLQAPPPTWPHDGFRPLSGLCRWCGQE